MTTRRLRRDLSIGACTAMLGLLAACTTTTPGESPSATSAPETSASSGSGSSSASPTAEATESSAPAAELQPAVWPDPATVLASPEEAAAAFVDGALGVPAQLGDYRSGDARSGEIELLFAGNPGADPVLRSTLLVRMLGPDDGWFVLAAISDAASITSPESGATVAAGPLVVTGVGRGFEGLVVIDAVRPGSGEQLDRVTVQGGSMETAEPFTATLDLSAAVPGETIALVVHGGVGHEEDPGDLGAIPVVVAG